MASPKPKRKPKAKKDESNVLSKSQSERFKETARAMGARTGGAFERAIAAIIPPRKVPKSRKSEAK